MATYVEDKLTTGITGRTYPAGIIKWDIVSEIKYHEKARDVAASLFAMQGGTRGIKKRAVISPKYDCYEREPYADFFYLAQVLNNSDVTFNVDDGDAGVVTSFIKINDVIQLVKPDFSAFEQMLVTAIPGSNQITVATRPYGTSSATNWDDNTVVRILHNASKEDVAIPTIKSVIPGLEFNYLTMIDTPMGGTYRFLESKLQAGGTPKEQQRLEAWIVHLKQKVKAALFDERYADTSDGRTIGEGLIPAILRRGGQHDAIGGVISFKRFLETVDLAFKVGGDTKLALMPGIMLQALAQWKYEKLVVMNEDKWLGLNVDRLEIAGNRLIILKERRLEGHPDMPKGLFGSCFAIIDPDNVEYCYFAGWDEKLIPTIPTNKPFSQVDVYHSDSSFRWDVITSHLLASGITGYE